MIFLICRHAKCPRLLAAQQDSGVLAPEATLNPGHSAQLHSAVINQSSLDLRLLNYFAQDWSSEYRFDFVFNYVLCFDLIVVYKFIFTKILWKSYFF